MPTVQAFLLAQPELELCSSGCGAGDNVILTIQLAPVPKLATRDYLDRGGSKPARQALATLVLMNTSQVRDHARHLQGYG